MKKKTLVLLDAHALLHRAYHALPEFTNSKGVPTGGVYGFVAMILRIAAEMRPDYIVACYDLPQKTFRHEAYGAYKGHRAKTDESLVSQIASSRGVCEKMGIPIYDLPGFEADDMLGTIVEIEKGNKELDIVIATGDMDSLQLVRGKKVRVFTLKKGINDTVVYDEDAVRERYGFGPEHLCDYKGLRGDPSDNIVGVPGIGEKTATDIILKFGTIENLYRELRKDPGELVRQGLKERVVKLLQEHEEGALFSKTLATIRRDAPIEFRLPDVPWVEACSIQSVEPLFRELEFKTLLERLRGVLTPGDAQPSAKSAGEPSVESVPIPREAQIALWLLNSELTSPTADDVMSYARASSVSEAVAVLEKEVRSEDLDFVYDRIELPLVPILERMQKRGVLLDVGFLNAFSKELHETLRVFEAKIYAHVGHEFNINSPKQLGEILFGEMNIQAGIKGFRVKKTASGTYSTRESDLEKLADAHPVIADIFEYRELQKLLSTYIDSLPSMVDGDGRLHPELMQTGTTTGRFSSQNPNIQNIPVKSELGKKIRNAFIAPAGFSIVSADYSQIELRSAAMLSGDPTFLETFRSGGDVHASVASRVFSVPPSEVTADMRRRAKVINFGILFGMGVTALQKNLGTDRKDAQQFYDEYFKQMPVLSAYLEEAVLLARKTGYTKTLFGRRRHFPGLRSSIPFVKAMAERAASNAPIQGTTADIIKLAMIQAEGEISKRGLSSKVFMVMQIHDELVFEVSDDVLDEAKEMIRDAMESVLEKSGVEIANPVPITVSLASGRNWNEAK